jgi:hypothetical protein
MSWHHTAIQTHESIWLTVYKSQSTRLGSENTINKYSIMKFTSLTTIVISAAAMAGIAIASEDLVITPMNLPCSPDSEHSCGLYADLSRVLTVIHRFSAMLDGPQRLEQQRRFRVFLRTSRHYHIIHTMLLSKLLCRDC